VSIIEKALEKKAEEKGTSGVDFPPEINESQIAEIHDSEPSVLITEAEEAVEAKSIVSESSEDSPDSLVIESLDSGLTAAHSATSKLEPSSRHVTLDFAAMEAKGMLIPDGGSTQLAEQYRQIKRPLLMNAFPEGDNGIKNANLVLVTSSLPGEGKTYTAINLAMSIAAERDKTVLLVDADVAKPSVNKVLGIDIKKGLIDMLENPGIEFSDVLLRTDIPKLSIIPAGRLHKYSTELLASDAMLQVTEEMSKRYSDRIIIFDSPPLMAASQGAVLCNLVGQVVMVIESDVTPQHIVQEAVSKLQNCDVVGCVLNKTKQGLGLNYYAYGNYGR